MPEWAFFCSVDALNEQSIEQGVPRCFCGQPAVTVVAEFRWSGTVERPYCEQHALYNCNGDNRGSRVDG